MPATKNITPHSKVNASAGLYVHIPFCRSKCAYCDFYSITDTRLVEGYLRALTAEMKLYRDHTDCFDTVYIGGGTPSCLEPRQIAGILRQSRQIFAIAPRCEITVEVNPGDTDVAFMKDLRDAGVNRVSIGVQSFDDTLLGLLGRRHSGRDGVEAIGAARMAGFDNLSIDLIYRVPGQTLEMWRQTLEEALRFHPEHLSCYELTLEEGTPLARAITAAKDRLLGEDDGYRFFSMTSDFLEGHGYTHYEVSNFARHPSLASRHNSKYWDHSPYLGLGPAAHSFQETRRWWNQRSLERYIHDLENGHFPLGGKEDLTQEDLRLEALYFGFRTIRGIRCKEFTQRYGMDLLREKGPHLQCLRDEGLVSLQGNLLAPTRRGLALADRLCLL
ncbi:MAG TPA: radical SAM family heme chaperone HemW [Syntrophales bacterium]|nr:radical SAM family heme chaperone HemW [Syntrophales bacterium]